MSWETLSVVAQLVATIGLFISLVYAGVQLRQSARLARVSAEQVAAAAFRDVVIPIAEDAELSRIWANGLANATELSANDQVRFFMLCFQALKAGETVHSSYLDRVMDEDTWRGWDNVLKRHFSTPGMRHYWSQRREMFAPRYQAYLESIGPGQIGTTVADLAR